MGHGRGVSCHIEIGEKGDGTVVSCKFVFSIKVSSSFISYGRNLQFDCRGIQIVVDYFLKRGHLKVYAFVPQFRRERNRADPTKSKWFVTTVIYSRKQCNGWWWTVLSETLRARDSFILAILFFSVTTENYFSSL